MQNRFLQPTNRQRDPVEEFKSSPGQERPHTNSQRPLTRPRRNPGFVSIPPPNSNTPHKFYDEKFPPRYESIVEELSEEEIYGIFKKSTTQVKTSVWRRADDIFGKGKYKIFEDDIDPNDIRQGILGDCYYLCSLAALAEKPKRIKNLFVDKEINDQGKYRVRIYDMGIWKIVTVDDYFPCDVATGEPLFAKSRGNELWVLILEKAWAKIYGSYARIAGGFPDEPLHDLTGAPTVFYETQDIDIGMEDDVWNDICQGEKYNYAMTCCTKSDETMEKLDILPDHAYSLLAALSFLLDGEEIRLVKLRNPWGQKEWTGDWSDSSPKWTPELREWLQVENQDDGIFWMCFKDLLGYFSDIEICKVHDNYSYNSLESNFEHLQKTFFKLNVWQSGHYYITINQENERKYAQSKKYKCSPVSAHLFRKIDNNYQYMKGIQKAKKEVWLDGDLDEGEYLVQVEINWIEQENKKFSISSYGEDEVEIEEISPKFPQKKGEIKHTRQQPTQSHFAK